MTTTELIKQLQAIEKQHGVLDIYVETKVTGIDWMDENGNRFEDSRTGAACDECDVDTIDGSGKVVWLCGTAVEEGNEELEELVED